MEYNEKCSLGEHEKIEAIMYCLECKINMCNKCINLHSSLFKNHHTYNLDNKEEIFTGICIEKNHCNKLEYFCKTHNKLCCCECIVKIQKNGKGQHSDCDICLIEDIEDAKKNSLIENIQILEELSTNLKDSINKLGNIIEKISNNKEELKLKIQNQFTKIRNLLNEREDELLLNVDKSFNNMYFDENFIKDSEKLPKKIMTSLERGKKIKDDWNKINLSLLINDCINIENNIKIINLVKDNLSKNVDLDSQVKFYTGNDELLFKAIKNFGVIGEINEQFKFVFKQGQNYELSNDNKIATKTGNDGFDCTIIGNKEIPKNQISQWVFKINSDVNGAFIIGVGPDNPNNEIEFYRNCWSLDINNMKLILKSGKYSDYKNNELKITVKKGDIIKVDANRINNELSFSINGHNCGIASSEIPQNDTLYPVAIFQRTNTSIEILD